MSEGVEFFLCKRFLETHKAHGNTVERLWALDSDLGPSLLTVSWTLQDVRMEYHRLSDKQQRSGAEKTLHHGASQRGVS